MDRYDLIVITLVALFVFARVETRKAQALGIKRSLVSHRPYSRKEKSLFFGSLLILFADFISEKIRHSHLFSFHFPQSAHLVILTILLLISVCTSIIAIKASLEGLFSILVFFLKMILWEVSTFFSKTTSFDEMPLMPEKCSFFLQKMRVACVWQIAVLTAIYMDIVIGGFGDFS